MKNLIKFLVGWVIIFLCLRLVWFDMVQVITRNDVFALHACIWPFIVATVCWTIIVGIEIDRSHRLGRRD